MLFGSVTVIAAERSFMDVGRTSEVQPRIEHLLWVKSRAQDSEWGWYFLS